MPELTKFSGFNGKDKLDFIFEIIKLNILKKKNNIYFYIKINLINIKKI